jgi:hypothetical protein
MFINLPNLLQYRPVPSAGHQDEQGIRAHRRTGALLTRLVACGGGSKHDGARMFREGLDGTDGRTRY